jgi:hypothetical protein
MSSSLPAGGGQKIAQVADAGAYLVDRTELATVASAQKRRETAVKPR